MERPQEKPEDEIEETCNGAARIGANQLRNTQSASAASQIPKSSEICSLSLKVIARDSQSDVFGVQA
jgi:hypothetical protein